MTAEINAFLQDLVRRSKSPGIQFARVDRNGATEASSAGWADLRALRPMTAATPLMAYSMSKVITAHTIWCLERAGLVRIDDPVARYLPDLPYGPAITLRHLLEHRSGIPNPIPLRWVHLVAHHAAFDERAALRDALQKHAKLRFSPGSKRSYSNLGYWLLGRVVERVTSRSFESFVEAEVLRPLDIGSREIGFRFPADACQARGYLERFSLLNLLLPFLTSQELSCERAGNWRRIGDHYVNGPAFGGAIGTAAGFAKFAWRARESGDPGLGWDTNSSRVQKEGGGAGFHCLLRLEPGENRALVVMSNATALDVGACLDRLETMN